jgi:hypothetical protein
MICFRDWITCACFACSGDPKWWSYPMPLNAFGVSGIFISSLVKASFHRSKTKMPLKLRLKGTCPGLDWPAAIQRLPREAVQKPRPASRDWVCTFFRLGE